METNGRFFLTVALWFFILTVTTTILLFEPGGASFVSSRAAYASLTFKRLLGASPLHPKKASSSSGISQRPLPSPQGSVVGPSNASSALCSTSLKSEEVTRNYPEADVNKETRKGERFNAELDLFLSKHADSYGYGLPPEQFNRLYQYEVGVRMPNQHYLDYTGAGLYTRSQLEETFASLQSCLLGNPHSESPSSQMCEQQVDDARLRVLRFLHARPDEYQVVFTSGATGALKMVGEYFPWSPRSELRYLLQNHNSVLGIREYAKAAGAQFGAVEPAAFGEFLAARRAQEAGGELTFNLWAFPAEENFAGSLYPLDWIERVKSLGTGNTGSRWLVLLDAAAFVPSHALNLSRYQADFVSLSFYKILGYPTGLGALIVRTDAVPFLKKRYWGGGSVSIATSRTDFHRLKGVAPERLEDGTTSFLDISALRCGFQWMERNLGSMESVTRHTEALREHLYSRLSTLRHSNGRPVARIFGQHQSSSYPAAPGHRPVDRQGPIVNFVLLDEFGFVRPHKEIERRAGLAGIHLRTGCSCNPGACYSALGLTDEEVEGLAGLTDGCGDRTQFARVARVIDDPWILQGPPEVRALRPNVVYPWERTSLLKTGFTGIEEAKSVIKEETADRPLPDGYQWVNTPLGSIRASLGYMSRFEDVFVLLSFIDENYQF